MVSQAITLEILIRGEGLGITGLYLFPNNMATGFH